MLSDGQEREENGYFKDVGDLKIWTVSGSFTFKGTDGLSYSVRYDSDEEGYRATVKNGNNHKRETMMQKKQIMPNNEEIIKNHLDISLARG